MIARLLICSDVEQIRKETKKLLSENLNHPDILYFESNSKLGIAEARIIKEHFSLKPYSAKGRSAVIENANAMTDEAQNALLKTIEELPQKAILILGASSDSNLLPTILSRCQIMYLSLSENKIDTSSVVKLLTLSLEERFEYVEKLKNREELLTALAVYFHQNIQRFPDFSSKVLQAERWAKQNVNIRAILEYLMLVMPEK
jgi:DNA polymerase-3 subunit delta'